MKLKLITRKAGGKIYLIMNHGIVGICFHDKQWNPSCEATPFAPEKWPFKRSGLSSGVKINEFMFRFTLSRGLSRGFGLSSGWPLKMGFTVVHIWTFIL